MHPEPEVPRVRLHLPVCLVLSLLLCGCDDRSGGVETPTTAATSEKRPTHSSAAGLGDPLVVEGALRVDPPILEITGVSQCGPPVHATVTLVNEGDQAEPLERTISSCGCAMIELEPGTVVPAGGRIELPVIFKAWGAARRKAHDVRFILAEGRLGPLLRMEVQITSPLRSIPSALQQHLHGDGRIRIVSGDEEPFTVIGVEPPIPCSHPTDPATQVELVIDWEALAAWAARPEQLEDPRIQRTEAGTWDRLTVEVLTDHPECARLRLELFGARHTSPMWNKRSSGS